jgi:hypothetical protein
MVAAADVDDVLERKHVDALSVASVGRRPIGAHLLPPQDHVERL